MYGKVKWMATSERANLFNVIKWKRAPEDAAPIGLDRLLHYRRDEQRVINKREGEKVFVNH